MKRSYLGALSNAICPVFWHLKPGTGILFGLDGLPEVIDDVVDGFGLVVVGPVVVDRPGSVLVPRKIAGLLKRIAISSASRRLSGCRPGSSSGYACDSWAR